MSAPDDAGTPPLRALIELVWRRLWFLVVPVVCIPVLVYVVSSRATPSYEASADILLRTDDLAASVTGVALDPADPNRSVLTQAEVARTATVAGAALQLADRSDRTAIDLLAQATVSADTATDLLRITIRDEDSDTAQELASAYAAAYVEYRRVTDVAALTKARADIEAEIARLEEQGRGTSVLADDLRAKGEQLAIVATLQSDRATVLREPTTATQIEPRPRRSAVLSLLMAILVGIGLALAVETLDTRYGSARQISDVLGIPLLARLPDPDLTPIEESVTLLHQPRGPAAEAYRMLGSNLALVASQQPTSSILVTAAGEHEGKSTTAANLAVALARLGQRVVLLDLDLRVPSQAVRFEVPQQPGFTELVRGVYSLDETLASIDVTSSAGAARLPAERSAALRLMPSGARPDDMTIQLMMAAVEKVVTAARADADIVVIDAPPLLSVGDTLSIARAVDSMLIVVNRRMARAAKLRELHDMLEGMPVRALGVVVTAADDELGEPYGYSTRGNAGSRRVGRGATRTRRR